MYMFNRRKVVRENEDVFRFGEDEDFNCSAEGYPPPSYYWTRIDTGNRTSSGPKMSIRQLTHGNRLIRRTINGTYACTAYNDLGTIKTTVDLIVIYPPNCTLAKMGEQKKALVIRVFQFTKADYFLKKKLASALAQ